MLTLNMITKNYLHRSTFAQHLADVFQLFPRDVSILPSDDISIQNSIPQSVNDIQQITPVTLNQVTDIIWSLNTKKSPGYDLITAKVLKELPRIGIKFVLYYYYYYYSLLKKSK